MIRCLLLVCLTGCIQAAKLPAEHTALNSQIDEMAQDKWAEECAPRETALAISHAEFLVLEFQQGDVRRATEHMDIARENAAIALAKADACRPKDRDGDAIWDHEDGCPDEPEDRDEFQDEDGCPDPDNDGDGIVDADDDCPDEPEIMNGYLDTDGCPDEGPSGVDIARNQIVISEKILFDTGRATIKKVSHGILDAVVSVLGDFPDIEVRVEGHTDSQGSASSNQRLSEKRANSVRQYLINNGVAESRLTSQGFGEDKPIDTNRTSKGRSANRRVEFHIVGGQDE